MTEKKVPGKRNLYITFSHNVITDSHTFVNTLIFFADHPSVRLSTCLFPTGESSISPLAVLAL